MTQSEISNYQHQALANYKRTRDEFWLSMYRAISQALNNGNLSLAVHVINKASVPTLKIGG